MSDDPRDWRPAYDRRHPYRRAEREERRRAVQRQRRILAIATLAVGMLIFIAIGGDGWMIHGLAKTYDLVPLLAFPSMGALVGGANAAFGIVSRVSPQMNVFAVGMPAKIIVALLILGASLPFVGGYMADALQTGISDALNSIQVR